VSRFVKGRIFLAAMVLVTGWSVWAFAQGRRGRPAPPAPPPGVGAAAPAARPGAPFRGAHPAPPPPPAGRLAGENGENGGAEREGPEPFNFGDWGTKTPPFLAMLINFGILAAGYYLLGRKPIAAGLKSRRDAIAKDIEDAQKMRHEAEERAATYQAKLASLEEEMTSAREALVRAGEAERDRIVGDAEAKAERMRKDAEFLVEQEMKQIRQDLWRDTVEVAVSAAEDLLKKRVTPADQERIAEDYLADLGGKRGASIAPPPPAPPQESAS
jgi:F-type H+-transporting ATPase subunit b